MKPRDDLESVDVELVVQEIGFNRLQEELLDNTRLIEMIATTNWIDHDRARREVRYMTMALDCWYDDPQSTLETHVAHYYGVK